MAAACGTALRTSNLCDQRPKRWSGQGELRPHSNPGSVGVWHCLQAVAI